MSSNFTVSELASEGLWPPEKKPDASVRKLAGGILNRAFLDLTLQSQSGREAEKWQRDAREWFVSNESYPGSLSWVCAILNTDEKRIRQWAHVWMRGESRNDAGLRGLS